MWICVSSLFQLYLNLSTTSLFLSKLLSLSFGLMSYTLKIPVSWLNLLQKLFKKHPQNVTDIPVAGVAQPQDTAVPWGSCLAVPGVAERYAFLDLSPFLLPTVYGHNVKSSNDFIGRIVIGQYSTGAPESNHWRRMLNAHRTAVEQWHSLRSREECDRVSPASLEVT